MFGMHFDTRAAAEWAHHDLAEAAMSYARVPAPSRRKSRRAISAASTRLSLDSTPASSRSASMSGMRRSLDGLRVRAPRDIATLTRLHTLEKNGDSVHKRIHKTIESTTYV